jgi:hypothetical protein
MKCPCCGQEIPKDYYTLVNIDGEDMYMMDPMTIGGKPSRRRNIYKVPVVVVRTRRPENEREKTVSRNWQKQPIFSDCT